MFAAISPAGVPVSISKSAKCNDQPSRRAASIRPAPSSTDLLKRSIFATSNPAAFPSRTALSVAKAPGRPLIVFALIPSSRNSSTIVSPLRSAYAHKVALWASMPRPDAACSDVDTRRYKITEFSGAATVLARRRKPLLTDDIPTFSLTLRVFNFISARRQPVHQTVVWCTLRAHSSGPQIGCTPTTYGGPRLNQCLTCAPRHRRQQRDTMVHLVDTCGYPCLDRATRADAWVPHGVDNDQFRRVDQS
jgi:hypothetical protein